METTKSHDIIEGSENLQSLLNCCLEDLLFFLKHTPMNGTFKCNCVRDIIKLGMSQERPQIGTYIMPMASSCLPMLFAFLSEGQLPSLEDHLVCAETAVALLAMFPQAQSATLVNHCFLSLGNDPQSVVDFSVGETKVCLKLRVAKPLSFKLFLARALLRIKHCLTPTVMTYLAEPITTACFQYSPLTCLGFRTLHMWLSLWKEMDLCLKKDACANVYTIIADNWENQTPGVRKEIVKVFCELLDVACPTSDFTQEKVFQHVMKDLSWKMKSKYFILSLLIPKYGMDRALEEFPEIVPALVTSLGSTRLTSSGTDTYRVCLVTLPDLDNWCQYFLEPVVELLSSKCNDHRLAQINLLSRWLTPTLRQFPGITHILYNLLKKKSRTDLALSALIHQSRKEGYISELWPEYSIIDQWLNHSDEDVRKYAFGAVCKKTKKTLVPPSEEFEAVKKFLTENVNVDSSSLRQSLIDSFSHFVNRLHSSSVKLVSAEVENECTMLKPIFTFLDWLYKFLLRNLKLGGNYQRKVTSLRLFFEVLKWFGPQELKPCDANTLIRSLAKKHGLWHFDSEESWNILVDCILSPTEDIQKVAADILAYHLKLLNEEFALDRAKKLWTLTLHQCSSAIFYEAESGKMFMKLVAQFIKEFPSILCIISQDLPMVKDRQIFDKSEMSFPESCESGISLQPLINLWHQELMHQWSFYQEDVFHAVTSERAGLHGALAAYIPLVPHFSEEDVALVLRHLRCIVNHSLDLLSGHTGSSVSASFAEMTEAINSILPEQEGGDDGDEESRCALLSPSHQLVLSCVWLTLRESCLVAAAILCHRSCSGLDAMQCLTLVQEVLLRCRYKGTIEAAGSALGLMTSHITSDKETRRCLSSFLPDCGETMSDFLENMLLMVLRKISVHSNQTSVTRRSAGLGILVQKIVAADSRPHKPLLQLCMYRLCEVAELPLSESESHGQTDLPQACALHLLVRLVADATLHSHILSYASAIALLCFRMFTSHAWTIRNAALQLFGVLVPLMAGEKKVHDDDTESFGNVTTEEFISHHPTLITFFLDELQKIASYPSESKNIIPILSFMSKLTFGDDWSVDNQSTEVQELHKHLFLLLKNSDLTVRTICAKCYSRFTPKNRVFDLVNTLLTKLKEVKDTSENEIHGYLVTILHFIHRLIEDGADIEMFRNIHQNVQDVKLHEDSWVCRATCLEVIKLLETHCITKSNHECLELVRNVVDIVERNSSNCFNPVGIHIWALKCIEFTVTVCSEFDVCNIWTILYASNQNVLSKACICELQKRIPTLSVSAKEEITNSLLSCISNSCFQDWELLCSIYTALLDLISYVKIKTSSVVSFEVFTNIKNDNNIHCWSIALPLVCEMFAPHIINLRNISQTDSDFLKMIAVETFKRTSAEDCDVEARVHGAKAFVTLYRELACLHSTDLEIENLCLYVDVVNIVLDSGIAFMQDEDTGVRQEASKYSVIQLNPYSCLQSLLSVEGLRSVYSDLHIARYFLQKLLDWHWWTNVAEQWSSELVVSPFDCGVANIYAEYALVEATMADGLRNLCCHVLPSLPPPPPLLLPPPASELHNTVIRLLHVRQANFKDAARSTSDLQILLIKLQILVHLNEKLSWCVLTQDYNDLAQIIASALGVS